MAKGSSDCREPDEVPAHVGRPRRCSRCRVRERARRRDGRAFARVVEMDERWGLTTFGSRAVSRKCDLTGKKANNGYAVSFSHRRSKKLQQANLQWKRVFWEKEERVVRLKLSTKAIKTLERNGLDAMAKEAGLDLYALPYQDASAARKEYVAKHPGSPKAKNPRAMKESTRQNKLNAALSS